MSYKKKAAASEKNAAELEDNQPLLRPTHSASNSHDGHGGGHQRPLSSVPKTFGNIVISIVGSAVLGMPYTFRQSGWVCGALVLSLVAVVCYYTMILLVWSKKKVENRHSVQSLGDLGLVAFGRTGELVVDFVIVLSQGSFCVAYLIFIGENLASVFTDSGQDSDETVSKNFSEGAGFLGLNWNTKAIYIWIIFPFQVCLATIRSLTLLAPFSIFADAANLAAMLVVMGDDTIKIGQNGVPSLVAFTGWSTLPYVVGVSLYAFEGYGLVLPLESDMQDRSQFGSTLAYAMVFITTLYVSFASLGYFTYGELTLDIITLNLGGSWETYAIKTGLCLGLYLTFPVMMHPVHELLERRFTGGRPSNLLRIITVLVVALTAVSVPHFGDFLSLIGSSVCCFLAFIVPAALHLKVYARELPAWEVILDYALIVSGAVMGVWGTVSSLINW